MPKEQCRERQPDNSFRTNGTFLSNADSFENLGREEASLFLLNHSRWVSGCSE